MQLRLFRSLGDIGPKRHVRSCHTDLFKLYGREAAPESFAHLRKRPDAVGPAAVVALSARAELERYEAEAYARGSSTAVTAETRRSTSQAICKALLPPSQRGTSGSSGLWMEALRVLEPTMMTTTTTGSSDTPPRGGLAPPVLREATAEACIALLLSHQPNQVPRLASAAGLLTGAPVHGLMDMGPSEFSALARIAACYAVACTATAGSALRSTGVFSLDAVSPVTSLLVHSRDLMVSLQDKDRRRQVVTSIEALLFSLDWLFHALCSTAGAAGSPASLHALFATAKERAPRWMRDHLFSEGSAIEQAAPRGDAALPPALLLAEVRQAAASGDLRALHNIYATARRKEEARPEMCIFELPKHAGEAYLASAGGAVAPQAHAIVNYLGTSLAPHALADLGNSKYKGREALAVSWLSKMRGPEAYAAVKKTLFHHPADQAAQLQLAHGDLLTGHAQSNWLTALEMTRALMATAHSAAWRQELPTTLRLLSDAGRHKEFFQLIQEFDRGVSQRTGTLMVASALAQAMRRTGKWQHYQEVLDLVAAAEVPSSGAEDVFLEDASLQLLYTLRNAKRWREAAEVYGALRPAMPQGALRVFASAVTEAAASAPQDPAGLVSQLLQLSGLSVEDLPTEFRTSIALYTRAESGALSELDLPHLALPARLHASRACVDCGVWQPLLAMATHQATPGGLDGPSDAAAAKRLQHVWGPLFRSLERTRDLDVRWREIEPCLPSAVWRDERTLLHLFHAALWNGWLAEFRASLASKASMDDFSQARSDKAAAQTRRELLLLLSFLLTGTVSGRATGVRHSLIGHYLTSFATATAFRQPVDTRARVDARGAVAKYFRVPPVCVGEAPPSEGPARFFLRPYPAERGVELNDIAFANGSVIVAYKPSGAVIQSAARGVLSRLKVLGSTHHIVYLLAPGSDGLFVLMNTACNPKSYALELTFRLGLLPLGTAHAALLSASFFQRYSMKVLRPASVGGEQRPVVVTATCGTVTAHNASDAIRGLRAALNEEGWTLAEDDAGGARDALSVRQVRIIHRGAAAITNIALPDTLDTAITPTFTSSPLG